MNHFQDAGTFGSQLYILGSDGTLGRDEFLRLLYGAQVSLEVGVGATLIAMFLGLIIGSIAGFFGGWIDTVISRVTEITMAFPYLLFVIALASTVGDAAEQGHVRVPRPRASSRSIVVFGIFELVLLGARLPRPSRSRSREGVRRGRPDDRRRATCDRAVAHLPAPRRAARSSSRRSTSPPTSSPRPACRSSASGSRCRPRAGATSSPTRPNYYLTRPLLLFWPGLAVVLTTLAFNLLGDGLRDAFDPRSQR